MYFMLPQAKALVEERSNLGNFFKISVIMQKKRPIFDSDLSYTTIDWTANGNASAS